MGARFFKRGQPMAVWAYECRPCAGSGVWWVARERVDAWPPDVNVLRMKVGAEWRCAVVDRTRAVAVEAQLLREAVASDVSHCTECAEADPQARIAPEAAPESAPPAVASGAVQAAAITMAGLRWVVVLVPLDLVQSPGEAEMLITDLRPRFGGVDVVLMAQDEDGTPQYHGSADLLSLLGTVPVDRMPWKTYPIR
jgi:hypothetical protein